MNSEENLFYLLSVASVLGSCIGMSYARFYAGYVYSRTFVHACVLTVILCAIVIRVIATVANAAVDLTLGGAGAAVGFAVIGMLGLIRFRTVTRDAREFVYLYLSIATGVAVGASQFVLAFAGCLVSLAVLAGMEIAKIGETQGRSVRIKIESEGDIVRAADVLLKELCSRHELVGIKNDANGRFISSFDAVLHQDRDISSVIRDLKNLPGVLAAHVSRNRAGAEKDD